MSTTYKGDSPGKKLTRLAAWMELRRIGQAFGIPYQGALCLAGEGGDLSVLRGLASTSHCRGRNASEWRDFRRVTAVDRDPFLLDYCKDEFPHVNYFHGDLKNVVGQKLPPWNYAHIDFCGGLQSVDNLITTAKLIAAAPTPSVVAITMLKGREQETSRGNLMEGVSSRRRRNLKQSTEKGTVRKINARHLVTDTGERVEGRQAHHAKLDIALKGLQRMHVYGRSQNKPLRMKYLLDLQEEWMKMLYPLSDGITGFNGCTAEKPCDDPSCPCGRLGRSGNIEYNNKAIRRFLTSDQLKRLSAKHSAMKRMEVLCLVVECLWAAWDTDSRGNPIHEVKRDSSKPYDKYYTFSDGAHKIMYPMGCLSYHSGTKKGGGSSFFTAFFLVHTQKALMAMFDPRSGSPIAVSSKCDHTGNFYSSNWECPFMDLNLTEGIQALNPTIAEFCKVFPDKVVADLFCVEKRSLPAIKAHATRGTYEGYDPLMKALTIPTPNFNQWVDSSPLASPLLSLYSKMDVKG